MSHPGDEGYDPLRHNYAARSAEKRAADDLEHGVPAMDKVMAALRPESEASRIHYKIGGETTGVCQGCREGARGKLEAVLRWGNSHRCEGREEGE